MATTRPRYNKNGEIISYEIKVALGRDVDGKQIQKYHTFVPEVGMKPKQIEKALEREAVLFEEKCRKGEVLDTNTRFTDFAEYWLDRKKDTHSPAYQKRARSLLVRINAGIGHKKISDIQPHHLHTLYSNLSEAGIKKTGKTATSDKLSTILKERKLTHDALCKLATVSIKTVSVACSGKAIALDSAEKIAQVLEMDIKALFTVNTSKEALSGKTVLHHHRIISAIMESAVIWGIIFDNPCRRVEKPKAEKTEAAYLNDKEVLQVIEALQTAPLKWKTITMLLTFSGMRRGEACGLKWNDIDFENHIISINKSNQYLPEHGIFEKDTKTYSSTRTIKLPVEMFTLLLEHQQAQARDKHAHGSLWNETNKVFTQADGKPIHPDSITAWVADFRKANSLPYFSPHSLRHTSATLLIMQGVPVKAVSARLGHANQNITNTTYSHAIQTVDAMASDVLGDILKPIPQSLSKQHIG